MRFLKGLGFCSSFILASSVFANTAADIGRNAGRDMANQLWSAKYQEDCFRSDRFLNELHQNERSLSGSNYHRGYRQGVAQVADDVAQSCHSTQSGPQGQPAGECPLTGFQHGTNLGGQVCSSNSQRSLRSANTCYQQALATCYDGLKKYVAENCRSKLYASEYRKAERDCQQTFARR